VIWEAMKPAPPVIQILLMKNPTFNPDCRGELLPLTRAFYQRPTTDVARALLGLLLLRKHPDGDVMLRIVETEAYLGVEDPACHTYGGRSTPRVRSMWGAKGHAYIYLVYGIHHCFNVVSGGEGEAVLIRGGIVVEGEELVLKRRGTTRPVPGLCAGPGKLCQALDISRVLDGIDLCDPGSPLRILDDGVRPQPEEVGTGPRIGIDYAGEAAKWPLRFFWKLS